MGRYLFQAKNAAGKIQMGQLEGIDEADVRTKLRNQRLVPLKVLAAPQSGKSSGPPLKFGGWGNKVSSKDLQIFTRQFSTLINAGIPVVDCLKLLSEGKRNPTLKEAAVNVRVAIEAGKRLGDAMASQGHVFDRFFVNMVRAGEEAGILDGILLRLSTYMEKSEKIKKQVKSALVMPAGIIVVSAVVISGILIFVIPKFQDMFASAGRDLPAITKVVVSLSKIFIDRWYLVIAVLVGTPWALMSWHETPEGKQTVDRIAIRLPGFGELIQKSAVAKLARTLSTLLSSGVSVMEALDIASRTAGNVVIEEALLRSKESVMQGKPLAAPLAKEPLIPDMVSQMIAIGESSGTLDTMLGKIADFYEDDVENAVKGLTSLIEPLLMVILGGVIGILVLAMYLPIFDMANVVGGG
ncbi:MAG: type II secretion system F family protein [Pseudobdellovibrionaceae bacterium]